jgi:hypothetical protein
MPDYTAHPFLDPELFHRDRNARRYFHRLFRDHLRNDWHYGQLLNRLLHPLGEEHSIETNEQILASYLADASQYVRELLQILPPNARQQLLPDAEVVRANNLRDLASFLFRPGQGDPCTRRIRQFEAQRKLYLTKLLLQIENVRMVQDGPRHRSYLNDLLDRELFSHVVETRDWSAHYRVGADGHAVVVDSADDPQSSEFWQFHVRRIRRQLPGGNYDLEIFHADTRFKRETAGYAYEPGRDHYEVVEAGRYGDMKRSRSASILSKMLRKGINDPALISDMLGVKFIVAQEKHVHQLVELLHQVLGGPFFFRNQIDLFRRPSDRAQLNPFSAPDFKVFKEDIDLLYPARGSGRASAYSFSVELQILTVDSFLRTLQRGDYVSHRVYKTRQFLRGVMPYVFPIEMYPLPDLSELLIPM